MNGAIILGIVVMLIAITFLLMIFMPTPQCYFSFNDIGYELEVFTNGVIFKDITKNIKHISYTDSIHTIYDKDNVKSTTLEYGRLYKLLQGVPAVERAFIKQIAHNTRPIKTRGAANMSNKSLRCVLPLVAPTDKSGMWLDGKPCIYKEQSWIIYDNSKEGSYYNKHKRLDTYIFVVDIVRPDNIPIGISLNNDKNTKLF